MSESSKTAAESARKHFGDWTDHATAVFASAIAMVASVGMACQAASSLGEATTRWGVILLLLLLCLGGLVFGSFSTESSIVDHDGKPMKKRWSKPKAMQFGIGALFFVCFLVTDVTLNIEGYFSPIEHKVPKFSGGTSFLLFNMKDGERLKSKLVQHADYIIQVKPVAVDPEARPMPLAMPSPEIVFEFRKLNRVKELLIHDVTLTVLDFSDAPSPLPYLIPQVAAMVPETIIAFALKKQPQPIPWTFKPIATQLGEKTYSDFKPIAVTDNFTNLFRFKVSSLDPGIYKISIKLDLESDFHAVKTLEVMENPVTFLFVRRAEGALNVKSGEEVMVIKPNGRFEMTRYDPGNPYFPYANYGPPRPGLTVPSMTLPGVPSMTLGPVPPMTRPDVVSPTAKGNAIHKDTGDSIPPPTIPAGATPKPSQ
jgi:hypothetical protein